MAEAFLVIATVVILLLLVYLWQRAGDRVSIDRADWQRKEHQRLLREAALAVKIERETGRPAPPPTADTDGDAETDPSETGDTRPSPEQPARDAPDTKRSEPGSTDRPASPEARAREATGEDTQPAESEADETGETGETARRRRRRRPWKR